MQTILNVEGMSCSHCENAVKTAVLALNGVMDVKVDLAAKLVTVTHDESRNIESIKITIEAQGYTVAD
ncbi:MAG: cation transporter [Firmicutes bacterium]|nr:cation transporter [Bacillota bacterium]